ncbi:histidine kinase [Amycolatopsis endophytica]|uniref:histidine kinase n=1 Tax=Amycolatopsis endophytica TaxID=860233 RepID=A0A853BCT0_9PSEU|nr:histidine kinase [Amycolatopsis endophytica]NYI93218.1 signal transduction histidine kinase [Amycolatopsis endophytica]
MTTRPFRYTDELLRPLLFGTLVVVVAVQLTYEQVAFPAWTVPLFVVVAALALGSLVPWSGLSEMWRFVLALVFAVLAAILLPLAQSTVAPAFPFLASAVAGEKLGSRRAAFAVAGAGAVATAVSVWLVWGLPPLRAGWPLWLGLAVVAPVFAGIGRRDRRDAVRNAQRAAEAEVREATLLERSRIAREIHDVLGHSLSGVALQLDMADALHAKGRDEEANAAVRRARALAVGSMGETRRAIEALRDGALPLERTLELMAEGASALEITGEPAPVPSEVAHAVIRVAQEALTNAAKHAPGAERSMTLSFRDYGLALVVRNDPSEGGTAPGLSGGMGLVGMRERIALLGGSLRAGPDAAGGWIVEVEVPR